MVLFDEDPVTLIRETTNQFHIAPDRDSLARISGSLSTLSNARAARISQQQSELKALSRKLAGLQEGLRWEEERHDAGGHAERMLRMDTDKFRIAKEVANSEIEEERLESELASLKAQAEVLEKESESGRVSGFAGRGGSRRDGGAEDEVVLKLHLYRSLGITATQDESTGKYVRAIVHRKPDSTGFGPRAGEGSADVNVIDLERQPHGRSSANLLWDAM